MRWREIVGPDPDAEVKAKLRSSLTPGEYAEVYQPGLTPSERERMYNPDAENEELEREERRVQIIKIQADARRLHAEADRAEAEAAAHRAGIRRPS